MSEYIERCPFCGKQHNQRLYINIICDCGAKYYFHVNTWLDRKTGLKQQGTFSLMPVNCKDCMHEHACEAWVRHGTMLYDDYSYSVNNCPYYQYADDVVDRKHGQWERIVEYDDGFGTIVYHRCSQCGRMGGDANFCPNCGADMKGGRP